MVFNLKQVIAVCIVLGFLAATPLTCSAQKLEGNTWIGFVFEKEVVKDLELELGQEFRFSNFITKYSSSVSELSLTFKPNKYIRVGGGYRYTYSDFRSEHRGSFSLTPRYKFKDFTLSFRVKYQLEKSKLSVYSHGLREKISLKYGDFKDWRPYVYAESFFFARNDFKGFNRIRIGFGNEIDLVKGHDLDISLFYQQGFNQETPSHSLTLGLSYNFNP